MGLNDQFTFYASYHNDFINQVVHIIFVPWIALGGLLALSFVPDFTNGAAISITSTPLEGVYPINASFCYSTLVSIYYVFLEGNVAGTIASLGMISAYIAACKMKDELEMNLCWNISLFMIIFSFAVQIFSHQVFEKRSPAFLDNVFQAVVMAPLFIVMETMFFFGYRQEFRKVVQVDVDENIKKFRASKKKKKT